MGKPVHRIELYPLFLNFKRMGVSGNNLRHARRVMVISAGRCWSSGFFRLENRVDSAWLPSNA